MLVHTTQVLLEDSGYSPLGQLLRQLVFWRYPMRQLKHVVDERQLRQGDRQVVHTIVELSR